MKKFIGFILVPIAITCLMGCGEKMEDDAENFISTTEATYLAALEDDDLGTGEGTESSTNETFSEDFECSFEQIRERIRNRFDRNRNGSIDPDENNEMSNHFSDGEEGERPEDGEFGTTRHRRGHHHHKLRRLRWIYDADNSRSLDEFEREELKADLEARCKNQKAYLLANFDTNNDGALSQEEKNGARQAKQQARQERRDEMLEAADTNNDGEISREERRAAHQQRRANRHARRKALKEMFDTNEDGELNDEERTALRQYLREWIRGEHLGDDHSETDE